jgi:ABC-2 type transport system permease protein
MDKKIFIVAKREYLERVRTRSFLITTLLVPVLMSGVFLIPLYVSAKSKPSGALRKMRILDASGTGVGARVVQGIRADSSAADSVSGPFLVTVTASQLKAAEDSAVRDVMKPKSLSGYLVLDDSTMIVNRARYVGRNATTISDMDRLRNAVRQAVMVERLEAEGVKKETIDQVASRGFQLPTQKLDEKGKGGSGAAGLLAGITIGVMLLMSIIMHGQNVMRGVLEEKTTRVAEIVISSVKPESLLAGKVMGVGGVGLTQIIAWLGLGGYVTSFFAPIVLKAAGAGAAAAVGGGASSAPLAGAFGGIPYGVLGASLAFFLAGFVFYATLYAAVGSMVNSEQEAQQAATPVMILLMSGWIFLNPVLLNPNSTLAVILSWLPWTSPIIMPIRMGLTSVSPASIAGSLSVAILGSLAAVWLAARIYRVGMLMYGKKPSFSELAKWIRYA